MEEFISLCEKRHERGKATKLLTFTGIIEPTSHWDLQTAMTNSLHAALKLVVRVPKLQSAMHRRAEEKGRRQIQPQHRPHRRRLHLVRGSPIPRARSRVSKVNRLTTFDVRQMPTAKFPPAAPLSSVNAPPKAPPKAKAKSVHDARTAHAAAHGSSNGAGTLTTMVSGGHAEAMAVGGPIVAKFMTAVQHGAKRC